MGFCWRFWDWNPPNGRELGFYDTLLRFVGLGMIVYREPADLTVDRPSGLIRLMIAGQ